MMLTSIYHILSNNEDFHPDDYEATVHPWKPEKVALTLDNTLQSSESRELIRKPLNSYSSNVLYKLDKSF